MKKIYTIGLCVILLTIVNDIKAQYIYNMEDDIPIMRCGFTYRDPGGAENYENNLNYTQILTSDNGGQLLMTFSDFSLDLGDFLYIYDGTEVDPDELLGAYSTNNPPYSVLSSGISLTLRFISNSSGTSSGWVANVQCFTCIPATTINGSPCSAGTPNSPFCAGDNPYAQLTYSSSTGVGSDWATSYFGLPGPACLGSVPNPAWFYFRVSQAGNLNFYIQQIPISGGNGDVDYACWGPFHAPNRQDFATLLCCSFFNFHIDYHESHRPTGGDHTYDTGGYPFGNLVDCSYYADATEWCYIPNAQVGEWYLILITNYSDQQGSISFNLMPSSTGLTDCSITSPFAATPVCEGQDITIVIQSPTAGAEYDITGPNNYHYRGTSTSITIPNATVANAGEYTLIVFEGGVPNGEPSFNEIIVYPRPDIVILSEPVCIGEEATFTVSDISEGGNYSNFAWVLENDSIYTSSTLRVTTTDSNYYRVVATTMNGCVAVDSARVFFNPNPEPYIYPDSVCPNSPLQVYPNEAEYTYHWSSGESSSYIIKNNSSIATYTVTVTDPNGCMGTTSGTVVNAPVADFNPDKNHAYLENGEAGINFIDYSTDASSWFWNFGDSYSIDNSSNIQSPTHIYTMPGRYYVRQTVYSSHNCVDSTYKIVTVEAPYFFYIPNSFTPNGDGINDLFFIKGEGIDVNNFEMIIFDRFGKMVFKTTIPGDTWDGCEKNGKLCPIGEYIYVIKTSNLMGEPQKYIGAFALIR